MYPTPFVFRFHNAKITVLEWDGDKIVRFIQAGGPGYGIAEHIRYFKVVTHDKYYEDWLLHNEDGPAEIWKMDNGAERHVWWLNDKRIKSKDFGKVKFQSMC